MSDKIELLSVTGIVNERTTDSAIPQSMFEQLLAMGIEHPGAWFATDCETISPKLHHVGEAYVAFFDSRSKSNGEKWSELYMATKYNGTPKFCFYSTILGSDSIMESLDAGTADFEEIETAFNYGWVHGQQSAANELEALILNARSMESLGEPKIIGVSLSDIKELISKLKNL